MEEKLSKDKYMTELEKQNALEQFKKFGYVSKSCSTIIHSNKNITTIEDCDGEILSED